jgi:hypothetical protein
MLSIHKKSVSEIYRRTNLMALLFSNLGFKNKTENSENENYIEIFCNMRKIYIGYLVGTYKN